MVFMLMWALFPFYGKLMGQPQSQTPKKLTQRHLQRKLDMKCYETCHIPFQDVVVGSTRLMIWKSKDTLNYKDIKHISFDRRTLKSATLFIGTLPHAVLCRTCAVLFWVFRKWNNFMEIICKMFLKFFCSLLFYESVKNLREALLTFYMLIFLSKENGGFLNFHI